MNENYRRVPTRFAPETRFEVAPVPAVPFRGERETELDQLQRRLLREWLEATPEPEFNAPLRRAANEAAALAWMTPCPLLVFPELFNEMAKTAVARGLRQNQIRYRSQEILAAAA